MESAGDSPQGKSDVVQSRQDGGFYPTRGRWRPRRTERERQRETRKLNGECSVVEGPPGVSTGTTKAKVRCAVTSEIQSPTRLQISGPWGDVVEAQCQLRTLSGIYRPPFTGPHFAVRRCWRGPFRASFPCAIHRARVFCVVHRVLERSISSFTRKSMPLWFTHVFYGRCGCCVAKWFSQRTFSNHAN